MLSDVIVNRRSSVYVLRGGAPRIFNRTTTHFPTTTLYRSAKKSDEEKPEKEEHSVREEIWTMICQEVVVPTKGFVPAVGHEKIYTEMVKVTSEEALMIFAETRQQSLCSKWYKMRKYRISASKAHQIAHARKEETCLQYFKTFAVENANMRNGREMEGRAKVKYSQMTGYELIDCGLLIKPSQPWLCATPDSIVNANTGQMM